MGLVSGAGTSGVCKGIMVQGGVLSVQGRGIGISLRFRYNTHCYGEILPIQLSLPFQIPARRGCRRGVIRVAFNVISQARLLLPRDCAAEEQCARGRARTPTVSEKGAWVLVGMRMIGDGARGIRPYVETDAGT